MVDVVATMPPEAVGWDALSRAVWLFDPVSCRGLYANPYALELWGADSREELLARDFSQLSPAVRARTDRLAQATAGGAVVTERWTFYPNGEPLTVQAAISTFRMPDGRAVLLFEAAPEETNEGERRAVEALRHTSSIITLFDREGRAVFSNPAAFRTYGPGELGFAERFAEPDAGARMLARATAGEACADLRRVTTPDGERWHYLDARPVTDPATGTPGVLLNEQDVTAQIEAERAARTAEQRAGLAEARQRFLANMSHELRTPLNAILGFSAVLEARVDDEDLRGQARRIGAAGETLLGAVNDMILLAALDAGEVSLKAEPFEPEAVLREAADRFAREAADKGLALTVEAGAVAAVEGDAERLGLILDHFVGNAVKFTETGGIVIRLEGAARGGGAELTISVSDTGPGIDENRIAALFDRFVQADDGATRRKGGGGLGLAVCKELADLMGGTVRASISPGGGSRFELSVFLPLAQAAGVKVDEAGDGGPLRVLYADDHASNRAVVVAMLASQGHACDTADDGVQAVKAFLGGTYDLVLMDIQMPVMDGVEAARTIRALGGAGTTTPIVALTANTLDSQVRTYLEAGMQDCIAKPVMMPELLAKTAAWGARGRRESEPGACATA
ncbi:MAG: signal transduction histidine kinase/CheY-like chemotaxis protein [Brevundimonas sp.]|uniref:ATP-binding protein n=1 Tax=Brevundimonas sp. TaxID=1871086 RepID=UPI0039E5D47D